MADPDHGRIVAADFSPPLWLRNRHGQTLWPALLRRRPRPPLDYQRLALPDGDFLTLAWGPARPGPLVVLLHGLGGGAESGYIGGLIQRLAGAGLGTVVMQFRGVGVDPNLHDRFYHAAAYEDLAATVAHLRAQAPQRPLAAVGYSLGASILLNWLGESGPRNPLAAACAISVPFQLDACARALEQGFGRLYQWDLVRALKRLVRRKFAGRTNPPLDLAEVERARTLWEFDDRVTARLHGFAGADDYYARASCRKRLAAIRTRTLILQAEDDPFVPRHTLPRAEELAPSVTLELSRHGGHVGFVAAGRPRYWLEERVTGFLAGRLATQSHAKPAPP